MFSTTRITSTFAASLALWCLSALPTIAGKPPKGGGGTTEIPNSPTVQYRATYLDAPASLGTAWGTNANDMNEIGTIVGTAHSDTQGMRAVMWYPDGTAIDLNAEATWIDATTGNSVSGWTAIIGQSINSLNQVVGLASASAAHQPGLADRVFVYDATNGFLLLPEAPGQSTVVSGTTYSLLPMARVDINDSGVVACQVAFGADGYPRSAVAYTPRLYQTPPLYQLQLLPAAVVGYQIRINNLGTISDQLGVVYPPYTSDDVLDLGSSGYRIRGLADDSNVVCGRFIGQGKGKNAIPAGAVRVDLGSSPADVFLWNGVQYGDFDRVNDQGDMWFGGSDVVYKEAWGSNPSQLLSLRKNEIINWEGNAAIEISKLTNSNSITDPDGTGHGAMCGTASLPYRAFVIFPESEPQP